MVQEVGYAKLRERGVELIAADSPTSFLDDGPMSKLVRQVLGAIAEFDKGQAARGTRSHPKGAGQVRGAARGHAEVNPKLVALAKRLRRASPKTGERCSLRQISAELAAAGHLNERGQPFNAKSIKSMPEQ